MSTKSEQLSTLLLTFSLLRFICSHIQAFEDALRNDVYINDNDETQSQPPNSPLLSAIHSTRVRKISALSDFAPINQRVSKRYVMYFRVMLLES
jgi:hypothetical protein